MGNRSEFEALLDAAKEGNVKAQYFVGASYIYGTDGIQDFNEGKKWLMAAIDQGDVDAMYMLGLSYLNDNFGAPDLELGYKYMLMAAQNDEVDAKMYLALLYEGGIGVEQDYKEAVKWLKEAIKGGSKDAVKHLAYLYYTGESMFKQDYKLAAETYKAWLDINEAFERYSRFEKQDLKHRSKQDEEFFIKFMEDLSKDGDISSTYHVYTMYRDGNGIAKDEKKAKEYFDKALLAKYPGALLEAGLIYFEGKG